METEKKYKVLLYTESFKKKSEANKAIARIKKGIMDCLTEISIEELAEKVGAGGYPVALCEPEGKIGEALSKKHWRSQQIYMLDFDNSDRVTGETVEKPYYLTGTDAVRISVEAGMTPAFGYHTLSNKKGHEKFRLVYALDEPCTTAEEHETVYAALSSVFVVNGARLTDDACSELSRVFYGGQKGGIFSASYGSTLSKKKLTETGRELIRRMALGKTGSGNTESSPRAEGISVSDASTDKMSSGELKRRMAFCKRSSGTTLEILQAIIDDLKAVKTGRKKTFRSLRTPVVAGFEGNLPFGTHIKNLRHLWVPKTKNPGTLDFTGNFRGYIELCSRLPWNELLDLPMNKNFCCILPEHEDNTPSARFTTYGGKVFYECYASSCDKCMNIFEFLEYVSGCSFMVVCKFLSIILDAKYEFDWQQPIRDGILDHRAYFISDQFKEDYEILAKYMKRHKLTDVYMDMLEVMLYMMCIGQVFRTNRVMFYIDEKRLCEKLWDAGSNKSSISIKRSIKELEHLGLIVAIPDKNIPPKHLERLRAIQEKAGRKYRMTCYYIPVGSSDVLRHACEVIERSKENNVRAHARRTREGVMRASGKKAANEIFVQQTKKKFSEEVKEFYEHYKKAIKNLFIKKGWTTEKEIINRMHFVDKESKKFPNKKDMLLNAKKKREAYSVLCLPNLIEEGLVQVVRFSKAIEEEYGIDKKAAKLYYGSSKVIVPGPEEFGD